MKLNFDIAVRVGVDFFSSRTSDCSALAANDLRLLGNSRGAVLVSDGDCCKANTVVRLRGAELCFKSYRK